MLALMTPTTAYPASSEINPRPRATRKPSSGPTASSRPSTSGAPTSSQPMTRTPSKRAPSPVPPPPVVRVARSPSPSVPASPVDDIDSDDEIDIHAIPAHDLLKMLASLLTQIAQQNDTLPSPSTSPTDPSSSSSTIKSAPSPVPPSSSATSTPQQPPDFPLTTAARLALESPQSMLTFHARNIPTITLEAYLLRILKYCPTTNEVFLALLVYFERMGKLSRETLGNAGSVQTTTVNGKSRAVPSGLVIDSYNVHRLVIAGVTVASKFFSDVFYTNSRYAKVGGLPQPELNQLELQFLLLNNFTLSVPHDEMQRYARELVRFGQRQDPPLLVPAEAIKKAKTKVHRSTPGTSTPPSAEQLRKQQEMGAIDAYGGTFPDGSSSVSQISSATASTFGTAVSSHPTMTSHPFLPSVKPSSSTATAHPFLPKSASSSSTSHPFLPSSGSSTATAGPSTARTGHFLQPGANGFDHSQGFGYSYDHEPASAPAQVSSFTQSSQRPRLVSTSSDASSLFTSDSSDHGDTETEDGSTEDEPTIRPNRSDRGSVCSFASSSTTSLYSEYGDPASSSEVEMDDTEDSEGAKTPETNAEHVREGERTPETSTTTDTRMDSP